MGVRVMIALNSAWNLVNFRGGLIKALVSEGYDVVVTAPSDDYVEKIAALGCRYIPLAMDNKGTHPGRDLMVFGRFLGVLRSEKPDVLLCYTVKPNVYGSLAALLLGVPVINNIAGLGAVFGKSDWLTNLVRLLYRVSLSHSRKVFFQNNEDFRVFIADGLVKKRVADVLPGSGVDLGKFCPVPLPGGQTIRFLLIARMLWNKGVGEFVAAARILKKRGVNADFYLLGFLDVKNPAAISRAQMDEWVAEGVVCYLGVSDNVSEVIAQADCVVLPSFYREGTPRALLEAAAMGRPLVTTDSVGCRDVVDDGVNGYLCRPRDAIDLADKMARIVDMEPYQREAMGLKGRAKVKGQYSEHIVVNKYIESIRSIVHS